ncbi:MAG: peroxiredoxin [Sphingomonadaceae bacterium]|nr:peroxiredoxin [Sphingomonadaceae bacterium]
MFRFLIALAAFTAFTHGPALAQLPEGSKAPSFATAVARDGAAGRFNLRTALAEGPVVLYFYPKAFTHGCTLETRAFAEAHDDFAAAGAAIVGMSVDDIATLKRFSTEECRGKFAVGVATPAIIDAYDVALRRKGLPAGLTNRTSYVIGQDGRIAFVHSKLDHRDHVKLALAAVRKLAARKSTTD